MIKVDRNILGRKIDFIAEPLVFPFINCTNRKFGMGKTADAPYVIPSLLRAMVYYNGMMLDEAEGTRGNVFAQDVEKYAVGFKTIEDGYEECYVEYKTKDLPPDIMYLTVYNPKTGEVRAGEYKMSTKKVSKTSVYQKCQAFDGTAVWLAMMPTLIADTYVGPPMHAFFDALNGLSPSDLTSLPVINSLYEDKVSEVMQAIEDIFITGMAATEIQWIHDTDAMLLLNKNSIENLTYAPTKKMAGEFEVFHFHDTNTEGMFDTSYADNFNAEDYRLTFKKQNLSLEELALIPEIPADNVVSKEAVELLDEMKATWNNPRATKITQALFEGGAGSGKSHMARFIAAVLQRPFVTFTCSPNTDEADIKGALLPVVNTEKTEGLNEKEKKILNALYQYDDEEMFNAVAEILGLPSSDDCYFDPEDAYEQITGEAEFGCDSQKAYSALCSKVLSVTKDLIKKCDSSSGEVQYKYIPSNIVRAIKNGWILELQEPSCMLQQGMLSCLFDALDKDSIGIINTPCGDIQRHEDFMIIATTNRKYRGTKPLNEAARSRFQYFLKLETPSAEVIAQRIMAKVGMDSLRDAMKIAKLFKELEEKVGELNAGAITLRGAYAFADAVKRGKDMLWAAERYLIWSASTDEDDADEMKVRIEEHINGKSDS